MFPIAGQTAGPIGLTIFVVIHKREVSYAKKKIFFSKIMGVPKKKASEMFTTSISYK